MKTLISNSLKRVGRGRLYSFGYQARSRWVVWFMWVAVTFLLLTTLVRGCSLILPGSSEGSKPKQPSNFLLTGKDRAIAFATLCAREYLTYNPADVFEYERRLSYCTANTDSLTPAKAQKAEYCAPLASERVDRQSSYITVRCAVARGDRTNSVELSMPVTEVEGRLAMFGRPVYQPPDESTPEVETDYGPEADIDDAEALGQTLKSLFKSLADASTSTDLAYYLQPGLDVQGFAGKVRYEEWAEEPELYSRTGGQVMAVVTPEFVDRRSGDRFSSTYLVTFQRDGPRWMVSSFVPNAAHERR